MPFERPKELGWEFGAQSLEELGIQLQNALRERVKNQMLNEPSLYEREPDPHPQLRGPASPLDKLMTLMERGGDFINSMIAPVDPQTGMPNAGFGNVNVPGGRMLSGGVPRSKVKELIKQYKETPVDIFNPRTRDILFENIPLNKAKKAVKTANEGLDIRRYDWTPPDLQDIEDAFSARQPIRPTYFSNLQSTFSNPKLPEKLDAKQVKNFLASRPGVTKDEMKWSGLDDLLEQRQGNITKKEMLNHLEENNIQVVETTAVSKPDPAPSWTSVARQGSTKFHSWTQPGGYNYREIKLVWGNAQNTKIPVEGNNLPFQESIPRFESPHFNEPNILAHFRTKDRMTPDGKKVLFVEEIQSDWHQMTRDVEKRKEWNKKLADAGIIDKDTASFNAANPRPKPPDAPFSKTWPELAMKRIMRMASEEGYDAIGWTTGEMQTNMYRKALPQVNRIKYNPIDQEMSVFDNRGLEMTRKKVPPEMLPEEIGQKNAENLLFNPSHRSVAHGEMTLDGPLTIGKEGMNTFYDQVLPQTANKLVKKWGARVVKSPLRIAPIGIATRDAEGLIPKLALSDIHFLPISPTMRESAKKAFPLFVGAGAALGLESIYEQTNPSNRPSQ